MPEDYIDPWVGLWVAIILWGFWFYLVVKAARQKRIKVLVEEDEYGFKDVRVYEMPETQWVLKAQARLKPLDSVADYVQKVIR